MARPALTNICTDDMAGGAQAKGSVRRGQIAAGPQLYASWPVGTTKVGAGESDDGSRARQFPPPAREYWLAARERAFLKHQASATTAEPYVAPVLRVASYALNPRGAFGRSAPWRTPDSRGVRQPGLDLVGQDGRLRVLASVLHRCELTAGKEQCYLFSKSR